MYLRTVADKFSANQLFVVLNVAILSGAATLALIRSLTDLYEPVPMSAATIGPLIAAWTAMVGSYVCLFLRLRANNELENFGAILLLAGLVELVACGFFTTNALTVPFRDHRTEEHAKIVELLSQANGNPAAFGRGNFDLSNMTVKLRVLHVRYRGKNGSTSFYADESTRAFFKREACQYLSTYSHYDSLKAVLITLQVDAHNQFDYHFASADCVSSPPNQDVEATSAVEAANIKSALGTPQEEERPLSHPLSISSDPHLASLDRLEQSLDQFQASLDRYLAMAKEVGAKAGNRGNPKDRSAVAGDGRSRAR